MKHFKLLFFLYIIFIVNFEILAVEKTEIIKEYLSKIEQQEKSENQKKLDERKIENRINETAQEKKSQFRNRISDFDAQLFPLKLDNTAKTQEKYNPNFIDKNEELKIQEEQSKAKEEQQKAKPQLSKKEKQQINKVIVEKKPVKESNKNVRNIEQQKKIDKAIEIQEKQFQEKQQRRISEDKLEKLQIPASVYNEKLEFPQLSEEKMNSLLEENNPEIDLNRSQIIFNDLLIETENINNQSRKDFNINIPDIEKQKKSGYIKTVKDWFANNLFIILAGLIALSIIAIFIIRKIALKDELVHLDEESQIKARDFYKNYFKSETETFEEPDDAENTAEKSDNNNADDNASKIEKLRKLSKEFSEKK